MASLAVSINILFKLIAFEVTAFLQVRVRVRVRVWARVR
jgi:hypothetical protein